MRTSQLQQSRTIGLTLALALLGALTGCLCKEPDPGWQQEAEGARPAAMSSLEAMAFHDGDLALVGDRIVDRCGALTSDQGGSHDSHIEGHSCIVTRTVVYSASVETAESPELLHAAMTSILREAGFADEQLGPSQDYFEFITDTETPMHVRAAARPVSDREAINQFDDQLPRLSQPIVVSENGGWGTMTQSFPFTGVMLAISVTYYDNVGI